MANILLADDDAAVRDLVRRALVADGHNVHVTQDGIEAFDYFSGRSDDVDLLVTDVDMPQLDGLALAEKILALRPDLPIVLMSGFSDQLDRADALRAKHLVSISKPFTLDQIKQLVKKALT